MSAADTGGGGIAGGVLGSFVATIGGGLFRHLTQSPPHLSRQLKQRARAAGIEIRHGMARIGNLTTNNPKAVRRYLRTHPGQVSTTVPDVGGDFSPITPGVPGPAEPQRVYGQAGQTRAPPKPPPAPPSGATPDQMPPPPGMPIVFGPVWQMLIAYAIAWGLPYIVKKASESWSGYIDRWKAREAAHQAQMHRRKPGGPGRKPTIRPSGKVPRQSDASQPGRGNPFPQTPVVVNVYYPASPAARAPASTATGPAAKSPELEEIKIYRPYLPMPAPLPAPTWSSRVWSALPTVAPLLLPLLTPAKKKPKLQNVLNYTDPLTQIQDAGLAFGPQVGDYGTPAGGQPDGQTCECGPKKKRGKKKPRTVCYRGTYTETASGLTKRKREKIPCRA